MYDVIVVGGGPGGSVCAREIAKEGFKVLLLEKDDENRFKPCAGGITPKNDRITPIKKEIVEREINSGLLVAPNLKKVKIKIKGAKGYIVFRTKYDQYLRSLAENCGAEMIYQTRVKRIGILKNKIKIIADTKEGEKKFEGKCFVGAFGINPASNLFEQLRIKRPPYIISIMVEVRLKEKFINARIGNTIETYLDSRITPAGSAWIYPKREGAAVGIISSVKSKDKSFKAKLFEFMNEHPIASKKLKGWKPYFRSLNKSTFAHLIPRDIVDKTYGDRFLLVGDAAGASDPLTGEGIYHAQYTGLLASRVLSENLKNDTLSENYLKEYDILWKKEIYQEGTKHSKKVANLLFEYPYYDFLINSLVDTAEGNEKVAEILLWFFTGERPPREIQKYLLKTNLPFILISKLGFRSLAFIPSIIKNYSIFDLI